MPASPLFGKLLRELREQAGLSQEEVASYLNVSASLIQEWEEGRRDPPNDPEFYRGLSAVPGFSVLDVTLLLVSYSTPAFLKPAFMIPKLGPQDPPQTFTESSDRAMIPSLNPSLLEDLASILVKVEPEPLRIHYSHTMPVHGSQIVDEGKWKPSNKPEQRQRAPKKGDIYQRIRTHYDREYLDDYSQNVFGIVFDAAKSNDPDLRPAAEQVLQSIHVFAESVAKRKGNSLSKVSREQHIPLQTLSNYVRNGLIPILYKDRNTTFLATETVEKLGRDKQDADEMGMQLARLLRERQDKYFPREAKS